MQNKRNHKKPTIPQEFVEAEKVAKKMYASLMLKTSPKATPTGYVLGACTVLKMLIDQASAQGADKVYLKKIVVDFMNNI